MISFSNSSFESAFLSLPHSHQPVKPQVGSTNRVWRHDEQHVALYFNCQSTLVESFRFLFADELHYSKNRDLTLMIIPTHCSCCCLVNFQ